MSIDLSPKARNMGLKFGNRQTGQEVLVAVTDKYPQMGDTHLEGRRVVEVSVEFFVELMDNGGWSVIAPEGPEPETDHHDEQNEQQSV